MKRLLLFALLIIFTGCTSAGAIVMRTQLDACEKHSLDTLVFKDKNGVTYGVICTVPDSEADKVVEIEILQEVVEIVKGH